MIDDCNINNLAKNQVSAVFNSRAIRRSVSSKFIEIAELYHLQDRLEQYTIERIRSNFMESPRVLKMSEALEVPVVYRFVWDAMLVPIQMGTNMAAGNQQKHLSLSFVTKV